MVSMCIICKEMRTVRPHLQCTCTLNERMLQGRFLSCAVAGAMTDVSNQGVMNAGLDFNPAVSNAAAGAGPMQQQPPQQQPQQQVVWRGK